MALDSIEGPGGNSADTLGGSATYASYAASFFAPTRLVACIGKDFPDTAFEVLKERGIDLTGLERLPGATFRWSGRYAPAFRTRETLSLDLGVFMQFAPKLGGALPKGSFLLLGNIDPDLQLKVLDQAGPEAFVAADTIDHWIKSKGDVLRQGLARTHLMFLNNEEAELLTGESNLILAGRKVQAMGPRHVVIKKGEHGAILFSGPTIATVPALPLERVVDPTGAGDVFAGAMLGCLAKAGRTDESALRAALAQATVLSSYVVEAFSVDRLRQLTHAAIDERVAQLRELARF